MESDSEKRYYGGCRGGIIFGYFMSISGLLLGLGIAAVFIKAILDSGAGFNFRTVMGCLVIIFGALSGLAVMLWGSALSLWHRENLSPPTK